MSKHKPTCRCVECEARIVLWYADLPDGAHTIRRLLLKYRAAMRLLVRHVAANEQPYCYAVEAALNKDIRDAVAKWREGK